MGIRKHNVSLRDIELLNSFPCQPPGKTAARSYFSCIFSDLLTCRKPPSWSGCSLLNAALGVKTNVGSLEYSNPSFRSGVCFAHMLKRLSCVCYYVTTAKPREPVNQNIQSLKHNSAQSDTWQHALYHTIHPATQFSWLPMVQIPLRQWVGCSFNMNHVWLQALSTCKQLAQYSCCWSLIYSKSLKCSEIPQICITINFKHVSTHIYLSP